MASRSYNLLSIQSHVVHGYVGNKSATFPLQVLGFEVDAINTVQLSNHTGYKHFSGQKMDDKELKDVFRGIVDNEIHRTYTHLLTGYVGNEQFLRELPGVVGSLRETTPGLVYLCDPVLGDNGHLYVPESFVAIYRDELLPLAQISTPNQFEAELLSGIKITDEESAWQALDWFHAKGVDTVVLSSTHIGSPNNLKAFLSCKSNDSVQRFSILMPKLGKCNFTGTGDLFAALFFAHYTLEAEPSAAMEKTVATVLSVIANTIRDFDPTAAASTPTAFQRELRIVRSKREIESPTVTIKCESY